MAPRTQYARSLGDVSIAYQTHGDGPVDLVLLTGFLSNVETLWEEPGLARAFDRLSEFARLVLIDRRGVGMSDRQERFASPEEDVADIDAVLDAVGSAQAAIYGTAGGAINAIRYVTARPERSKGLVLYAGFAKTTWAEDMPWARTTEEREAGFGAIVERWGQGHNSQVLAPSAAGDPWVRQWFARLERTALSPGMMRRLAPAIGEEDVRELLAQIAVPTLIMHRTDDELIDVRHSRYMAERIPGARYVELPGRDHLLSVGDSEALHGEIEEFLTGGPRRSASDRRLLTVLFTDIVDGTARAARVGDGRWRQLLSTHDHEVRAQLARYVELPGRDHLLSVGDSEALHGEIEEFLTGGPRHTAPDRQLLTVLFTDIVDGTARAARVGDGRWRQLLSTHDAEVRSQLTRYGGREVKTIGDGFLAVFDGAPSQAVRCARAIVEATAAMAVPVRAGLHTGECEVVGDDVAGMAVNIAARICGLAGAGEVMASGTTYGTVVGSGLNFGMQSLHDLRGVPGPWPVFQVG